ncbi:MAG: hypothetical protein ACKVW3_02170 [Phycisphaerales bacterium]
MAHAAAPSTKPRPRVFRALGRSEPPVFVVIDDNEYALVDCLKHDSWAATGIYQGPAGKVVCKFNRQQRIGPIPMTWLGRRLARREHGLLTLLAELKHVPRACGAVAERLPSGEARVLPNAVAHPYVEGHPLGRGERVADDFFDKLRATIEGVHARGVAYVDLHKRENIIVADDGSPCLIDFQVCFWPRGWWSRVWPVPALLRTFQRMDDYHLMKHVIRCRPDLLKPEERDIDRYRPRSIRVWRRIGDPLRATRRRILVLTGVRKKGGRAETEVAPEEAYRSE